MRALGGFGLIVLAACSGESRSDSGTGAGGGGATGGAAGFGGLAVAGSGGLIVLDGGGGESCPAPHDPYQPPYLPADCPLLSDAIWSGGQSCRTAPPTPVDALCAGDGNDGGPMFWSAELDPCTEAEAAPDKHASWEWQHPIELTADCNAAVLSLDGVNLTLGFVGSGHMARWVAASGDPTQVQLEANIGPNGCEKRLRITYGCDFAEVVLAELPAQGGQVSFGDQVLGVFSPSALGPACPNGPPTLCAEISWPNVPPGETGCKVSTALPTCGALVQTCACKGGELEAVAGRGSCEGPVRIGWHVPLTPYWRCL